MWQAELPGYCVGAPALARGSLFSTSVTGTLTTIDAASGEVRATTSLGEPSAGAVTCSRGAVLAGTGTAPYFPGESLVCLA